MVNSSISFNASFDSIIFSFSSDIASYSNTAFLISYLISFNFFSYSSIILLDLIFPSNCSLLSFVFSIVLSLAELPTTLFAFIFIFSLEILFSSLFLLFLLSSCCVKTNLLSFGFTLLSLFSFCNS